MMGFKPQSSLNSTPTGSPPGSPPDGSRRPGESADKALNSMLRMTLGPAIPLNPEALRQVRESAQTARKLTL